MTDAELTRLITDELRKVAPEADPAALGHDQPIGTLSTSIPSTF